MKCPKCGSDFVFACDSMEGYFDCHDCGEEFYGGPTVEPKSIITEVYANFSDEELIRQYGETKKEYKVESFAGRCDGQLILGEDIIRLEAEFKKRNLEIPNVL